MRHPSGWDINDHSAVLRPKVLHTPKRMDGPNEPGGRGHMPRLMIEQAWTARTLSVID